MGMGRSYGGEGGMPFDAAAEQRKAEAAAKRSQKLNLIFLVGIIVIFLVYSLFFQKPKIEAAMDGQAFALATLNDDSIAFYLTEVQSVELGNDLSSFDKGTLQTGAEESTCCSGTYLNDTYGEYELHVNLKVEPYIIIHYTDGVLVFNNPTADETTQMYTSLLDATSK